MKMSRRLIVSIVSVVVVAVAGLFFMLTSDAFFRIDLTAEKRYSLSDATRRLLHGVDDGLSVTIYLTGDLDANMLRLSRAAEDMVHEMNSYMRRPMILNRFNPNEAESDEKRYALYETLERRGLRGMSVSVRQRGGRMSEQIIFPWAEVCSAVDTVQVCLMQPSGNTSGEEAVNAAVEDLEFQFADAVRLLTAKQARRIAFVEGHGELDEEYVYDAADALSRYFFVDRGTITSDVSVLDNYAAIVIAGPVKPFTEIEKFVIDQYIMRGGRVLWLVDGTMMSSDMLSDAGSSPVIANDVKLSDMLFRYGVRITPSVLEDMQCAYIPVNMARPGEESRFESVPWFFTPLLQTSPVHPVTKSVGAVKADFASGIEIVGDTAGVRKSLLLATSNATHVSFAPNQVSVSAAVEVEPSEYFVTGYVPVAVALEGRFTSIYDHRMPPLGVTYDTVVPKSVDTRMIVVADADIIRNDVEQHPEGLMVLPLGYDRVTRHIHGNRDFIVNSMLYLTDDAGLMQLRNKKIALRLLNRAVVDANRTSVIVMAVCLPLLLLALFAAACLLVRRRRYRI